MTTSPKIMDSSPVALEDPDQLIHGVFEPPRSFAWAAIGRNKLLISVCALLVALLFTGYGLSRHRTYTASATLQVGQVNPNSPGFYSYVTSATALATDFSRAISAEPVLTEVQHTLKLSPSEATARLSSEPLPQSPAFRVAATGPTATSAIQLANTAANALITYESQANSANPEAAALLTEYHLASLHMQHTKAKLEQLKHLEQLKPPPSSRNKGELPSAAVLAGEAEKEAADVKLKAIGVAYVSAVTSQAPRSGLVSLIAGATSASSDGKSKVELLGFIGLLVGIVIGSVAAVLRERYRAKRLVVGAEI